MFVNTKCKCNGHTTKNNHLTAAKNKRIMIEKDVGARDSKLKWRVPISKSPLKSIAHTIRINWNDILERINYHQRHLHVKCQFESQPLCTGIGCGGRMGGLFWHRVGVGVSLYTFRMQIEWRQRNDQSNMNLILHLFSSRYKNVAAHLNWNIFLSSPFISFPSQIDNRNIFHPATTGNNSFCLAGHEFRKMIIFWWDFIFTRYKKQFIFIQQENILWKQSMKCILKMNFAISGAWKQQLKMQ